MVPQVLATIQAATTGERRASALGRYGATGGLAAVLGQVLGGLLVSANIDGLGWRPIFLVNVPIGLAGLVLAKRYVPDTRHGDAGPDRRARHRPARPDRARPADAADRGPLAAAGRPGRSRCWSRAPLVAIAFARFERRAERSGRTPLVPPSLLRHREHAPRPAAGAAVLRRLRRVHVLLRAAGAGGPARQRAHGRRRPRADGGHVPARIAVDLPAARAASAPRCSPPAACCRRPGLVILGVTVVPGLAALSVACAGAGPGGRGRSARAW